jgi:hypothetical protein
VQGRPAVASTIIGARTLDQLDVLPFPTDMLAFVPTFAFGGTTINGQPSQPWSQAPQNDDEHF